MPHRIEIRFCGPAPSDELSRARIIGNPDIADAMKALQERLEAVGFPCEIEVQTIKTGAPKTRAVHGRLNEAAE